MIIAKKNANMNNLSKIKGYGIISLYIFYAYRSMCACSEVTATEWIKFYRFLTEHKDSLEELVLQNQFQFSLTDLLAIDEKNNWNLAQLVEDIKTVQLKRLNLVLKINTSTFATSHDSPSNSLGK